MHANQAKDTRNATCPRRADDQRVRLQYGLVYKTHSACTRVRVFTVAQASTPRRPPARGAAARARARMEYGERRPPRARETAAASYRARTDNALAIEHRASSIVILYVIACVIK